MNYMLEASLQKAKKYEEAALDCSILYLTESGKYNEALALVEQNNYDKSPEILIAAAQCYNNTNRPLRALEIFCQAERKGWLLPEVLIGKGRTLFKLREYELAKQTFEQYEKIYSKNRTASLWILRCQAHMALEKDPSQVKTITVSTTSDPIDVKYDWYQNQKAVSMTLFLSNLTPDQIEIKFLEKSLEITANSSIHYHRIFNLCKEIIPQESKYDLSSKKIEFRMIKKVPDITWKTLESTP